MKEIKQTNWRVMYIIVTLISMLFLGSCLKQDNTIENYGLIEKQDVINIEQYINKEDSAIYKTGFLKDERGISYIDDSYLRVSKKCIKKIDGIEYLFDDYGYLAKGKIIYDVSYPMEYPINNYYPRLADEKGKYISEKGIYEVADKKYFVDYKGEVIRVRENDIVICNGKFYTKSSNENNMYLYEIVQINNKEVYDIYEHAINKNGSLVINNKVVGQEELLTFNKQKLIEELEEKYDLKNDDKYIYESPAIIKNDEKEKIGFHDIEYNDYVTEGMDDIWWTNYSDVSRGKIYLKSNNKYALDEIIKIGNKKYLFDKNNLLVENNIYTIGNKTYLTDKNGIIIDKEGVYKIINVKDNIFKRDLYSYEMNYYVNKNGLVEKNKFIEYDGNVYYAASDGNLYKNRFKNLLYFDDNCKLDKELIDNNIDFDEENKKEFFDAINKIRETEPKTSQQIIEDIEKKQKELLKREYVKNDNFKIKINDEYIDLVEFENYNLSDAVIEDKNGNILKNKFINLGYKITSENNLYNYKYFDYYLDDKGEIVCDKIIEINKNKYIFDDLGRQVKNVWLFDYDFFNDENKKSDMNPYIIGYRVKRNLIKKYLGYYVADYILPDKLEIENSYKYHHSQDVEDSTGYECFLIRNGEYNYNYDYRFKGGEAYYNDYTKEINYKYEQIDEGIFKYVHNKKGRLNEATNISEDNLTEQLSRYAIYDSNFNFEDDETVKFGSWYLYDKTGKSKNKIRWYILKKEKNKALLITEDIIDVRQFHFSNENISWSDSDLRKWLNEDFYNEAFSEEEKKYIYKYRTTDLFSMPLNISKTNGEYIKTNNIGDSVDTVFLMSTIDANIYLRKGKYSKNAIVNTKLSRYAENKLKTMNGNVIEKDKKSYWTKDVYYKNGELVARTIDEKGENNFDLSMCNNYIGVRPAIWVKYNNKDNNEYGKQYDDKEDLYYQYVLNKKDAYVNDEWNSKKEDLEKQIQYCKALTDYNDGEVIEETDHVLFGLYEIDGIENGKEDIKWTILDKDEKKGKALLVSKYIIDARHYNQTGGDVTWETSSIREWLNKDFYNETFNDVEKELIEETLVHTNDEREFIERDLNDNVEIVTLGGNDTKDKIFLLSTNEIKKYMMHNINFVMTTITENVNKNVNAERYLCKNSDRFIEKYDDRVYYSSYMTRSPGYKQDNIKTINPYLYEEIFSSSYAGSNINISGLDVGLGGIRPALWVKFK